MPDADLTRLLLAVLLPAPFAIAAGHATRDGREALFGGLFLALGSGSAALVCLYGGSLPLALLAAFVLLLLAAYLRFRGAQQALVPPGLQAGPAPGAPAAAAPGTAAALPSPAKADPLVAADPSPGRHLLLRGLAFLGDLLETADRIGEMRYRRRLRKLRRRQAARQGSAATPPPVLRVWPRRDPPKLP